MKVLVNLYNQIIDPENLFSAWEGFRRGKGQREGFFTFEKNVESEIFRLHRELKSGRYRHGPYTGFFISDPKRRHIHKATVRDRVLHHAIMKILYPFYDKTFIHNSFSCRLGKGTHRGVEAIRSMARKVSRNHTAPCYALKCDIEKFFDSVDHITLLTILKEKIKDERLLELLSGIIGSFKSGRSTLFESKGIPIGNLTSQLLANIYMNVFDQYVKHILKVKYYARYTDDFIILSQDRKYLEGLIPVLSSYLATALKISFHPGKVTITKYRQGIDFLGYVVFPHYTRLRKRTARRIERRLREKIAFYKEGKLEKGSLEATITTYLGLLSHADAYTFSQRLKNNYWLSVEG